MPAPRPRLTAPWLARLRRPLGVALVVLALGVWLLAAYGVRPLYSSNQNTYLLHGLASGGKGLLREDWMAQTKDATPVFSGLVELIYRLLPEPAFHALHAILAGLFLLGLAGIAMSWRRDSPLAVPARARSAALATAALVVLLHSHAAERLSTVAGRPLSAFLFVGVAGQQILSRVLQPSAFGVLLVVAIALFLRDRPVAAAVTAAGAATMHPTYVWPAAALDLGFLLALGRGPANRRVALRLGLASALSLLPIVAYSAWVFRSTSLELAARAAHLLVHSRIPHHTRPARWLGPIAYGQTALVVAALALLAARRSRLLPILLPSFLLGALLTLVQLWWPKDWLALLFPWRTSVYLVPVAITVLLSVVARALTEHRHHRVVAVGLASLTLVPVVAVARDNAKALDSPVETPLGRFVAQHRRAGDRYLVPPKSDRLRLELAAPVLVDHKTHPYKDVELLEWKRRLDLANRFYRGQDCRVLGQIVKAYGLSHAVVPNKRGTKPCAGWQVLFTDKQQQLWQRSDHEKAPPPDAEGRGPSNDEP